MLNPVQTSLAGISMPPIPPVSKKPSGGRVSTPKLRSYLRGRDEEEYGLDQDYDRYELLLLVKRAGKAAGFSNSMIALLEHYIMYTQNIDWQEGGFPIVFKSLENIALDMNLSPRQIQNLENQLHEAGAITWHDSGNHKRYGRRCPDTGMIEFAYGVELTPLAALKPVLERKLAEKQAYDRAWKETKRQISYYRRQIRAGLDALEQIGSLELAGLNREYETISLSIRAHMNLERLEELLISHKELHSRVDSTFEMDEDCELSQDISSKDVKNCAHIESTIQKQIFKKITGSDKRSCFQESRSRISENKTEPPEQAEKSDLVSILESAGLQHITNKQVLNAATPEFKDHIPLANRAMEWSDIVEAAYKRKDQLGISNAAWGRACQTLTRNGAAICLLLVDQGTQREENRVKSPIRYFNAMVSRAKSGELHLQKSVMGILKRESEAYC